MNTTCDWRSTGFFLLNTSAHADDVVRTDARLEADRDGALRFVNGALAELLRVYRRCREHLAAGLGVEPAPATEAIRRAATDAAASPTPSLSADF